MPNSPFFDDVRQVDTTIAGEPAKVPVFYYDGTGMTAVFPARLARLRQLMPDPRMRPARVAPGVGLVAISGFEYRKTDLRPYNELSIAIPLNEPYFRPNIPGRALAESVIAGQFHAFVRHLPVTTEIARAGGVDFYNYPKFLAGIEFDELGGERSCLLTEGAETIFRFSGPVLDGAEPRVLQVFSHIWQDGQPQGSEFKINALELGQSARPGTSRLELSDRHPIARELRSLLLSTRSIGHQHIGRFEAILYGPEHLSLPLLQRGMDALAEARASGAEVH